MIYIIFIISITFHEIGHIVMSKILKVKIDKPRFNFFGYSSKMNNDKFLYKVIVLLSGPIINFIFSGIVYNLKIDYNLRMAIFYMNLFLGIVNLFPILPLDGGNILKIIFEQSLGFEKSTRICLMISKIILVMLSLIYCFAIFVIKNIWIFFSLIYLWIIYIEEEKRFALYTKIRRHYEKMLAMKEKL